MDMHDDPESDKRTQSLADLPLTTEQGEETKAGGTDSGGTVQVQSFNFLKKCERA